MTSKGEWFHHCEPVSGGFVESCRKHVLEIVGIGFILKMFDETIKLFEMCRHVRKMEMNIQVVTGLDECKAMNGGGSRQRLNGPTVIGNPVSKVFLDKEV